jgi:plastocyanin
MRRAQRAVLAAAVVAATAGCGSGGYAPTNLTTDTAPAPRSTTAATSPGKPVKVKVTVTIANLAFTPHTITTTVGRPVEWINRDDVAHTVTTLDGVTISSPTLEPGARFAYVPAKAGVLRYYCTIHPSTMSGELIVRAG